MIQEEISVEYVDHMGNDNSVVNAARVSFAKAKAKDAPFTVMDKGLIKYLADHDHWTPFAHTTVQVRCKAPIFVARQLVKHQIGGVWNEESRRYIDTEPTFWIPKELRSRPDGSIKQGSGDPIQHNIVGIDIITRASKKALKDYNYLLQMGVAPEMARMVLPLNTNTNWIWTGSVLFWSRVCNQRLDPHAQKEAQDFAKQVSEIISGLYPFVWECLVTGNKE